MLFNSIDFVIFFPIVFILYWFASKKLKIRNIFILLCSYIFYGWWDWRFLLLIIVSSFIDFYIGKKLGSEQSQKKRKKLLYLSLFFNLGFLLYFKYLNFFIDSFNKAFTIFGRELEISTLNILLPVGISFYTFQTLSYTIDIYKKNLKPTNSIINFFAFVSFFPQLVAGPIERASHLLPQFNQIHEFDYNRVKSGFQLMLWGFIKKMVIADRLALFVNEIYNNTGSYSGLEFIIATIFFTFQIYCDFSGYSDIAIGLSRTMGFDLMKNFDSPYFSKSITEFWRRWHISLSTWFRDYVYIPLGGNKKGNYRTYLNLFLVFLISGLWHGASITFVIWGAIHGVIIVFEKITNKIRKRFYKIVGLDKNIFSNRIIFGLITFTIVSFAWIFFRVNTFEDSIVIIKSILKFDTELGGIKTIGESLNLYMSFILILILLLVEYVGRYIQLAVSFNNQNIVFRWTIYLLGIFLVLFFGVYGGNSPEFLYFKF